MDDREQATSPGAHLTRASRVKAASKCSNRSRPAKLPASIVCGVKKRTPAGSMNELAGVKYDIRVVFALEPIGPASGTNELHQSPAATVGGCRLPNDERRPAGRMKEFADAQIRHPCRICTDGKPAWPWHDPQIRKCRLAISQARPFAGTRRVSRTEADGRRLQRLAGFCPRRPGRRCPASRVPCGWLDAAPRPGILHSLQI